MYVYIYAIIFLKYIINTATAYNVNVSHYMHVQMYLHVYASTVNTTPATTRADLALVGIARRAGLPLSLSLSVSLSLSLSLSLFLSLSLSLPLFRHFPPAIAGGPPGPDGSPHR